MVLLRTSITRYFAALAIVLAHDWTASFADEAAAQGPLAAPKANREHSPRQRFREAKSFYTYYGAGKVAELSHYDVAILHPSQFAAADVKKLSLLGVVTVGYLTIGEDERLQVGNGRGPAGKASWYFDSDHDGQPDQDPIWKSWYANTNDPLWRATRVAEAKRLTSEFGCDGILLDLISVSELYPECRGGMIAMMRDLRTALPNSVIIMNQGFDIVGEVASLADGFMIESFTATYNFERKSYELNNPSALDQHLRQAQRKLAPVVKERGLRVLVLDYADRNDIKSIQLAANRAASLGYLFSVSPILLDDVYPSIPVGENDPKWLKRHASPEQLAWTLPTASNGFPAGTVAVPSGNFGGYTVAPMFDASRDRSRLHWSKSAWASAEDGEGAWLTLRFPADQSGGQLTISWHDAAGPSRRFQVQVRRNERDTWRNVESHLVDRNRTTSHRLPSAPFREVRIFQSPGGGSSDRPNLMWISRLELTR